MNTFLKELKRFRSIPNRTERRLLKYQTIYKL